MVWPSSQLGEMGLLFIQEKATFQEVVASCWDLVVQERVLLEAERVALMEGAHPSGVPSPFVYLHAGGLLPHQPCHYGRGSHGLVA